MTAISRRQLMQTLGGVGAMAALDTASPANASRGTHSSGKPHANYPAWDPAKIGAPLMRDPVWVYDNWAAYTDGIYADPTFGGVEDNTRLTEALSLKQLGEIARLKQNGVHFDYYMMNAFWFDPDGAYRRWRQPDWPDGPDRWISACANNGLKPGMWFGSNSLWKINAAPQWRDSLDPRKGSFVEVMSFYEGGFLSDFMIILQHWYDRGIRLFEFDVANFDAATVHALETQSPEEIRSLNQSAFREALAAFRRSNPDVMLVAFNDFGGDLQGTATPFPFKNPVDLRWLEVFDTLYTGDTRVSDVPLMSFWRSVDLFNDHMTRRYEQSGVPLERSDPFFTLSSTWFGYHRGSRAWKSMLLLSVARGSWKKTIYGDLSLLSDQDAAWFAKVQQLYAPLLAMGRTKTFGGIPGEAQPYGFGSFDSGGALYTVVNPAQAVRMVELPALSRVQDPLQDRRVLFADAGFKVQLQATKIELGAEQMAVVGFGRYAQPQYDLGIEADVIVPHSIAPAGASFRTPEPNVIEATLMAPSRGDLRILFHQRSREGTTPRSPVMKIEAQQEGKNLAVAQPHQDRAASTGISWGAGEIRSATFTAGRPITIRCSSSHKQPVDLQGQIYIVQYHAS